MKDQEGEETKTDGKAKKFNLNQAVEAVIEQKPWAITEVNDKVRKNFSKFNTQYVSLV